MCRRQALDEIGLLERSNPKKTAMSPYFRPMSFLADRKTTWKSCKPRTKHGPELFMVPRNPCLQTKI